VRLPGRSEKPADPVSAGFLLAESERFELSIGF